MSLIKRANQLFNKNVNTWLKRPNENDVSAIPSVKSLPIVGGPLIYLRTSKGTRLHEYIDARHKQMGSIFKEKLDGKTDLVFISDPTVIKTLFINHEGKYPVHILPEPWVLYEKLKGSKRGLFFMDGEEWLENRRIINKYLLKDDTEMWIQDPIQKAVDSLIASWIEKAKPSYLIKNLESDLYKFSINVIINILLGDNAVPYSKHYDELITKFSISVKQIFQTTTALYGLPLNLCQRLNFKVWRDFETSVDLSLNLAQKLIKEILEKRVESNGLIDKLKKENMNDETITRIICDLIIAAGDTTAYTTLWSFYLLAKNSEIVSEIRERGTSFIKFVIKETMRIYPVAPFLTRILPKEACFDGYQIKEKKPTCCNNSSGSKASKACERCFCK